MINGCIKVYGAKTFTLSADQKGRQGFPTHQSMSYLNSICKNYRGLKFIGRWEREKKREPDDKVVDTTESTCAYCAILGF